MPTSVIVAFVVLALLVYWAGYVVSSFVGWWRRRERETQKALVGWTFMLSVMIGSWWLILFGLVRFVKWTNERYQNRRHYEPKTRKLGKARPPRTSPLRSRSWASGCC